jgi:hypothetical protein
MKVNVDFTVTCPTCRDYFSRKYEAIKNEVVGMPQCKCGDMVFIDVRVHEAKAPAELIAEQKRLQAQLNIDPNHEITNA